MDVWKVCWKTNLSFQRKSISEHPCFLCDKFVDSGKFLSSFVQDCVSCSKGHGWGDFENGGSGCVCSACDRNLLVEITMRKQRCFIDGCEAVLEVDETIVAERVRNRAMFESYIEILQRYRVFTCVICYSEEPLKDALEHLPTSKCNHDINISRECMEFLLRTAIGGGQWREIRCPDSSCKELLTSSDVQTLASRETFEEYEKLISINSLSIFPDFRWCAGNRHKCGFGQIVSNGEEEPKWQCFDCKSLNCFNCLSLFHEHQTCAESQRDLTVDPETLAVIYSTTKKCPNRKCKRRITKNKLCKDMKCRINVGGCGIEFCWNCKIIYSGRSSHLSDCRFAGRIVPKPSEADERYALGLDQDPHYVPGPEEYTL